MANVVNITFNNDAVTDPNGNTLFLNGTVQINYDTNSYTGNYTLSGGGLSSNGTFSNAGGLQNSKGVYTITDGQLTVSFSSQQPSSATSESFVVQPIVIGGTTFFPGDTYSGSGEPLTSAPVCFASGTAFDSNHGTLLVENLAVGDLVSTADGRKQPIVWLGHRTIDCRRHPRPEHVLPVRISAHAFGENRPSRDLFVSPGHAICVDALGEVLIPAIALVNGTTIRQVEVEMVTYWHVELDSHDVILAENLPAESYIDCGNRGFFVESDTVTLGALPDAPPASTADYCRPFHAEGPIVEMVRVQLASRAQGLISGRISVAA